MVALVGEQLGVVDVHVVELRDDEHIVAFEAARVDDAIGPDLLANGRNIVTLFAILKLQWYLPINPQHFAGMENWLAFNTAVSFVSNTNWQNYGGETTLSHFSQMAGLAVHSFLSAATGIAVAFAFIRGFARESVHGGWSISKLGKRAV